MAAVTTAGNTCAQFICDIDNDKIEQRSERCLNTSHLQADRDQLH